MRHVPVAMLAQASSAVSALRLETRAHVHARPARCHDACVAAVAAAPPPSIAAVIFAVYLTALW